MQKSELKKIKWSGYMSVGIAEIDEQHKKFLDIANDAVDAIEAHNKSAINKILSQLKDYVHYHFKTEADLMSKYKYPESSYHHIAHTDFYDKVSELENKESETKEAELVSFMQNWFVLHIGTTDKKLAKFINNR